MTGRPQLELLVAPGTMDGAAPLVQRLARWADPRAADVRLGRPAATLATSATAPALGSALADGDRPVAVMVTRHADLSRLVDLPESVVLVTDDAGQAAELGRRAVLVDRAAIDAEAVQPLPPFVRSRWRRAAGLPSSLVVSSGFGADTAPVELVPTAFSVAAAGAVAGSWLVTAMALGLPVATDRRSADRVGAASGVEVLVASGANGALALAADLAEDGRRGAALGRAARRLVERRFDVWPPTLQIARRLGLVDGAAAASPSALVAARLAEMGTPPGARVRTRAATALAGLSPPFEMSRRRPATAGELESTGRPSP